MSAAVAEKPSDPAGIPPKHLIAIGAAVSAILGPEARVRGVRALDEEAQTKLLISAAVRAALGPDARVVDYRRELSPEERPYLAIAAAVAALFGPDIRVKHVRELPTGRASRWVRSGRAGIQGSHNLGAQSKANPERPF